MGKKIFVGNLSFDTTSKDLEAMFSQAGTCESVAVITDRATGQSRGFGFVEMSSASEAQKAIAEFNGKDLQGRTLNVSEARETAAATDRRPPQRTTISCAPQSTQKAERCRRDAACLASLHGGLESCAFTTPPHCGQWLTGEFARR